MIFIFLLNRKDVAEKLKSILLIISSFFLLGCSQEYISVTSDDPKDVFAAFDEVQNKFGNAMIPEIG